MVLNLNHQTMKQSAPIELRREIARQGYVIHHDTAFNLSRVYGDHELEASAQDLTLEEIEAYKNKFDPYVDPIWREVVRAISIETISKETKASVKQLRRIERQQHKEDKQDILISDGLPWEARVMFQESRARRRRDLRSEIRACLNADPGRSSLRRKYETLLEMAKDTSIQDREERIFYLTEATKISKQYKRLTNAAQWRILAEDRFARGYNHDLNRLVGGLMRGGGAHAEPNFTDRRIISNFDPILKLMLSKTMRGFYDPTPLVNGMGRKRNKKKVEDFIAGGHHKDLLFRFGRKVVALDEPFLEFNHKMRGVFRVDIDKDFKIQDLYDAIQSCDCPMPNVVVSHYNANDADLIVRPHLYWVLRDSVNFGEKGRRRPQNAYQAINNELYRKLRPMGADPGAIHNGVRGKNPFSPHNRSYILNPQPYRLAGQRDYNVVDNLPALAVMMGISLFKTFDNQNGDGKPKDRASTAMPESGGSNRSWHFAKLTARKLIGSFKARASLEGDLIKDADRQIEFTNAIYDELVKAYADLPTERLERHAQKTASWFWQNHDPKYARKNSSVMSFNDGLNKTQKRSISAARTNEIRRVKTHVKMAAAADELCSVYDPEIEAAYLKEFEGHQIHRAPMEFTPFKNIPKAKLSRISRSGRATPYSVDPDLVDKIRRREISPDLLIQEINRKYDTVGLYTEPEDEAFSMPRPQYFARPDYGLYKKLGVVDDISRFIEIVHASIDQLERDSVYEKLQKYGLKAEVGLNISSSNGSLMKIEEYESFIYAFLFSTLLDKKNTSGYPNPSHPTLSPHQLPLDFPAMELNASKSDNALLAERVLGVELSEAGRSIQVRSLNGDIKTIETPLRASGEYGNESVRYLDVPCIGHGVDVEHFRIISISANRTGPRHESEEDQIDLPKNWDFKPKTRYAIERVMKENTAQRVDSRGLGRRQYVKNDLVNEKIREMNVELKEKATRASVNSNHVKGDCDHDRMSSFRLRVTASEKEMIDAQMSMFPTFKEEVVGPIDHGLSELDQRLFQYSFLHRQNLEIEPYDENDDRYYIRYYQDKEERERDDDIRFEGTFEAVKDLMLRCYLFESA